MMDENTKASILARTVEYVRELSEHDTSGHDWWHIYRVWKLAVRLARDHQEADQFIIELAALLHDVDDWKLHAGNATQEPLLARAWLERCALEPATVQQICDIIAHASYKGAGVPTPMDTIEGMIVQDADRLDALGAIGIARAFAYGGHKGRPLHDPRVLPLLHTSFDHYRASQSTTINHFYEKLLLLTERMNTDSARAIARRRSQLMEAFLEEFFSEWEGRDSP